MPDIIHRVAFSLSGQTWFYVCENCETPINVDTKYCPNCGAEIVEKKDKEN